MVTILRYLLLVIVLLGLVGCKSASPVATVTITEENPVVTQSSSPYPLGQSSNSSSSSTYPGPGSETSSAYPEPLQVKTVEQLTIPTPSSGKAVITGQLVSGDGQNKPLIIDIYLSVASPASVAGQPPAVNFQQGTDPIATQELSTGRFLFADVTPGQYALVVLTVLGEYPLKDSDGNIVSFTVNPGETKDLGVISIR